MTIQSKRTLFTTLLILCISNPLFANELLGKVIKITDGDTVHLLTKINTKEKIRLAGIDAPEKRQAFGNKSKQFLADLIGAQHVTVKYDKRDRYGRIIGKILLDDLDINLEMVKVGLAWHYKKYAHEQSSDDQLSYTVAENNARKNKIGLWFDKSPVSPWKYRKERKNKRKFK